MQRTIPAVCARGMLVVKLNPQARLTAYPARIAVPVHPACAGVRLTFTHEKAQTHIYIALFLYFEENWVNGFGVQLHFIKGLIFFCRPIFGQLQNVTSVFFWNSLKKTFVYTNCLLSYTDARQTLIWRLQQIPDLNDMYWWNQHKQTLPFYENWINHFAICLCFTKAEIWGVIFFDRLQDENNVFLLNTSKENFVHKTSTGSPRGCVLSPLLFLLYTNNCGSLHLSVKLLKPPWWNSYPGMRSPPGVEIEWLSTWCSNSNLELNPLKMVKMRVDFRENTAPPSSIMLARWSSLWPPHFLGRTIYRELCGNWTSRPSSKEPKKGCSSCDSWGHSGCRGSC